MRAARRKPTRAKPAGELLGLAGPLHPYPSGIAELAIVEYSRAWAAQFLERHDPVVHPQLKSFISNWTGGDPTAEECWDVSHGEVRRIALHAEDFGEPQIRNAALTLALRCAMFGQSGEFESAVSGRVRMGRWLLPAVEQIAVQSTPGSIRLKLTAKGRSRRFEFRKTRGRWNCEGLAAFPVVKAGGPPVIALTPATWHAMNLKNLHESAVPDSTDNSVAQLGRAMRLLGKNSERYAGWVSRVLRGFIPCEGRDGVLRSGSDFDLPGIVQISFPAKPVAHAEMLVHECTHLYYQIACRLGDVHDASDETLYYSPVRRMGRPIDRILLAYHAFANVVLFYRDCLEAGVKDQGYCERNVRDTMPQLEQLEEALQKTRSLTPLGEALWRPLSVAIW